VVQVAVMKTTLRAAATSLTFSIAEDHYQRFWAGFTFTVSDSTGNNGTYTISSQKAIYDQSLDQTRVYVEQNIPSSVANGIISHTDPYLAYYAGSTGESSHKKNLNDAYKLASGSEAIGFAGLATATAEDVDGNPRDSQPDAGAYEFGADKQCDTSSDCTNTYQCRTLDGCVGGQCVYSNRTGSCDDGDVCTIDDVCLSGVCRGTQKDCDDGVACTSDSCSGGLCLNVPNHSACGTSTTCTTYACTSTGCQTSYNAGASCDDGITCTTGDSCNATGACSPGTTNNSLCQSFPDCSTKTCTTTGCIYTPEGCNVSPELILWMPFNGNMQDQSSYGNDGSCSSCPVLTAERDGNPNSAYEFDGSSQFIDIADNASVQLTGSMTIAAWVNRKNISGENAIVGKAGGLGQRGYRLICYGSASCQFSIAENATTYLPANWWVSGFPSNEWQHITGVYDAQAQTIKLYRNATLMGQKTAADGVPSSQFSDNGLNLNIGREGSTRYPFQGTIDDVRIYSKALSQTEIEEIYNESSQECVTMSALLGYIGQWKEGSIDMATLIEKIASWKTGC